MAGPQQTIQIIQEVTPWWQWAVTAVIVPLVAVAMGMLGRRLMRRSRAFTEDDLEREEDKN